MEIVAIQLCSLSLMTVASQAENRQLFHSQNSHHPPEALLELVQARFGAPALYGLTLGNDHRPELGWQPLPMPRMNTRAPLQNQHTAHPTGLQPKPYSTGLLPQLYPPGLLPQPRPAWLLSQPQLLEQQCFELLRGPERIEAAWWDVHQSAQSTQSTQSTDSQSASEHIPGALVTLPATAARDYYLARNSRGELCWIFHQHGSDNWFLHGYFA